jgi:hypothetical protein
VESDIRFFRRRATEELSAANRAVTEPARERRLILAEVFLERLKALEAARAIEMDGFSAGAQPAFKWTKRRSAN